MTNRSEEQFMNQVRDTFSNWEPQAPAGVQEAVYAQLGKGGFWRFSLTTLNAWTLAILGGAAALALSFGLKKDEIHQADTLQQPQLNQTAWASTYPVASDEVMVSGYPWEFPAGTPAVTLPNTFGADQAKPTLTIQEAPEALTALNMSSLQATVQLPGRLTTRSQYLNQDIWSQLQDEEREELKLIYDVKLSE